MWSQNVVELFYFFKHIISTEANCLCIKIHSNENKATKWFRKQGGGLVSWISGYADELNGYDQLELQELHSTHSQ